MWQLFTEIAALVLFTIIGTVVFASLLLWLLPPHQRAVGLKFLLALETKEGRRKLFGIFRLKAYRFDSSLEIREMIAALNQLGLWQFVERDNDRWGVYTSTCADRPRIAMVKILEDGGHYVVNLKYESQDPGARADWAKLEQDLKTRILPAIRAVNVQPTPDIE